MRGGRRQADGHPTSTWIEPALATARWALDRVVKVRAPSLFIRQTLQPFLSVEKRQDLLDLADLLEAGNSRRSSTVPTR
jgi:hypothetical protein